MNAGREWYDMQYRGAMEQRLTALRALNGTFEILPACDTLQVNDYAKFDMSSFSEEHKKQMRAEQFPKDLEKARGLGAKLGGGSL